MGGDGFVGRGEDVEVGEAGKVIGVREGGHD